ncbi:IS200/IS605 family transposase [Salinimicrobium xinjiangense]|uniref:IS200/IS605 family transposase n=1 Tax=Salinimicrobium xinjiangense TaxID=438596 RepID=UPI00048A5855|nr:IS200/IS605 family transposase [Salinimicrobium xinjiangense]
MANTYTQIHIHFIFSVKFRQGLIGPQLRDRLYQYIVAIVRNNGHKTLIVNGMADHVHLLIGLRPDQSISDLAKDVKSNSSKWINEQKLTIGKFAWQEGFGAFAHSKLQLPKVVSYIEDQEEHHRKKTFQEEYLEILEEQKVEYNVKYIFKTPE